MKRLIAIFLAFVMVVTGVYITKPEVKEVQASETSNVSVASEAEGQKLDMLTIKMQALEKTYKNDAGKDCTDLRIVSSVDSMEYKRVGFKIWYDVKSEQDLKKNPINFNTWEVATRLEAGSVEYKYSPKVIDTSAEYFFTATLKGILTDNYDKNFYIKAYYITLDGQTVEGAGRFFNLNVAYDKTIINIPVEMTQEQYDAMSDVKVAETSCDQVEKLFYDGKYAHLNLKVADKTALKSASLVQVGSGDDAPKAIHRNLLSKYTVDDSGNTAGDTSWYDVYDEVYPDKRQFVIANEADLYGLASKYTTNTGAALNIFAGDTFYLIKDMEMNKVVDGAFQTQTLWKGIGKYIPSHVINFAGNFDGQGHTISGIYRYHDANAHATEVANKGVYAGFFNRTQAGVEIKNFTLENCYFEGANAGTGGEYLGGITGYDAGGSYENISVKESVTIKGSKANAGGFVGSVAATATQISFKTCEFKGTVSAPEQVGGFAGNVPLSSGKLQFDNCFVGGTVKGTSKSTVAGFCGSVGTQVIYVENCVSVAAITRPDSLTVGFFGASGAGTVTYNNAYTTCGSRLAGSAKISTYGNMSIKSKLTADDLSGDNAFINTALNFKDIWTVVDGKYPELRIFADVVKDEPQINREHLASGDLSWYDLAGGLTGGTKENPYILKDAEDLLGLAILSQTERFSKTAKAEEDTEDPLSCFAGKYFVLANDITVNYNNNTQAERFVSWTPIAGTGTDNAFKGNFNGNHHTISGLYYNDSTKNTKGLFARISNSPTIENICLSDCVITANKQVGALAGAIESGTYRNIHIDDSVQVTSTQTTKEVEVGGLVGRLVPYATINIEQCWVQATVVATFQGTDHAMAGGIVGRASKDTTPQQITINNCMVEGNITTQAKSAGGICGYVGINTPVTIQNCVSVASVVAKEFAGGVLGALQEDTSKTYGSLTRVIVDDSYTTTSKGVGYGQLKSGEIQTGLTTEQLTGDNAYSYTMLDFDNVWTVVTGDLLMLRVFAENPKPAPTYANKIYKADTSWFSSYEGTEEEPYVLEDASDLIGLAQLSKSNTFEGKYIILANDITVNKDNTAQTKNVWDSIGATGIDTAFKGSFDGKGYAISGLYQEGDTTTLRGLFARTGVGAEIKNLILKDCDLSAQQNLGSLVGFADGGYFSNIHVMDSVQVSAATRVGGVVGGVAPLGDIVFDNCDFEGTVKSDGSYAGGLIAYAQKSSRDKAEVPTVRNIQFKDCSVDGNIEVKGSYSGGYCGSITLHSATFLNCKFNGTLTSNNEQTGGFIGHMDGITVCMEQCQVDATVTSQSRIAGGFIGWMGGTNAGSVSMKYCLNTGIVDVSAYQTTFKNDEGKQECNPYVGGFIGLVDTDTAQQTVDIKNCISVVDIKLAGIEAEITTYGPILGHSKSTESTVIERTYVANDGKGSHIIGQYEQLSADKMKGASAQDNMPLLDWSVWGVTDGYPTLPFDATGITTDNVTASPEDVDLLANKYSSANVLYQGELHAHAKTYGNGGTTILGTHKDGDDGKKTLAEWKDKMGELSLDFAASYDHNQIHHFNFYENKDDATNKNFWEAAKFIYGTEASSKIGGIIGTGSANDQGKMHYNLIFSDDVSLKNVLKNAGFTLYSDEKMYSYKNFSNKTEFDNFISEVKLGRGFFVHAHPTVSTFSSNELDYWFGPNTAYTGFEVLYKDTENESQNRVYTESNYKVWKKLLNEGYRLYATAGSDTHDDLNVRALTSIYSTQAAAENKGVLIQQLQAGNFTAGPVGIQMCIENAVMGGHSVTFAEGQKLVINIDKFHEKTFNADHKYMVSVLNDQGVVYAQRLTMDATTMTPTNGTFAIPVDADSQYYRVEVYDMTDNTWLAFGNPIWNGEKTYQ